VAGAGGVVYGADGKPIVALADTYAEILAKVRDFTKADPRSRPTSSRNGWPRNERRRWTEKNRHSDAGAGHDEAAEVFKYLGPKKCRSWACHDRVGNVSREEIEAVLREFHDETSGRISLATRTNTSARF